MKHFLNQFFVLTLLIVPVFVSAFTVPVKPTGFVADYAQVLSNEQLSALETKLEVYEKNTTNEIAVVTVISLDGDTIENLAQEIFTTWGIGKKDKDNGVLMLISTSDRKMRIHTGYGVEGDLTDLGTSYIQQEVILPAFKTGDYYSGINNGVDKIIQALGGEAIVPDNYSAPKSNGFWNLILITGFILFQIIVSVLARSKSWWGGGVLGGVIGLAIWHFFIASIFTAIPLIFLLVGFGLLFDFAFSRAYNQKQISGKYPRWFGGGNGFGRGGGGGFGGFGGGRSGGGGSSSSW